jgi:hypothetical protein
MGPVTSWHLAKNLGIEVVTYSPLCTGHCLDVVNRSALCASNGFVLAILLTGLLPRHR